MDHIVTPKEVNVLYIEDNEDVVRVISDQLNSTNTKFNITVKPTLAEAITFLREECTIEDDCDIDVILIDLMLPNSHGVDTFKQVRDACGFLPIVIVSAHEDIACECVSLGAQDYLVKPDVPTNLLIRSIKYAISRNCMETKMRNVIMSSTLGYHMYKLIDDKLIFTGYNPAANEILGVDNSKYLGRPINEAFPNLAPEVEQRYREAIRGRPWKNQIIPYVDNNIHKGYFKINAYRTAKNRLTVTFEDVTTQMINELKLKESEERYRTLVEATGAAIFGVSFKDNKFTYVNDAMCEQLGYTKEELHKMTINMILTKDSNLKFRERVLALRRGEIVPGNVEYVVKRKDGKRRWIYVTSDFVTSKTGKVIGANVVAIDITEKKLVELKQEKEERQVYQELERQIVNWKSEIDQKRSRAEERLQLIDRELLSMKHDFNITGVH